MTRKLFIFLPLLALASCFPTDVEEFADDSQEAKATSYIQNIIDRDFKELKNSVAPGLKNKLTHEKFEQMRDQLGAEEPKARNLVGYNKHIRSQNPTRYNLTYQYGYEDRWIIVNVAFRTLANGKDEILGLNVYKPMDRPLQEVHRFTMEGKGIIQYLFLTICILVPLFIIITLVAAIRTKFKKRKWLWIIFISIGIVKFSLNWTTGQTGLSLLHFQLFGAGMVTSSVYAPLIMSFSLPIGALLFWLKRDKLKYTEDQPDASATPTGHKPEHQVIDKKMKKAGSIRCKKCSNVFQPDMKTRGVWSCPECHGKNPNLKRHYRSVADLFIIGLIVAVIYTISQFNKAGFTSGTVLWGIQSILLLVTIIMIYRYSAPWTVKTIRLFIWIVYCCAMLFNFIPLFTPALSRILKSMSTEGPDIMFFHAGLVTAFIVYSIIFLYLLFLEIQTRKCTAE